MCKILLMLFIRSWVILSSINHKAFLQFNLHWIERCLCSFWYSLLTHSMLLLECTCQFSWIHILRKTLLFWWKLMQLNGIKFWCWWVDERLVVWRDLLWTSDLMFVGKCFGSFIEHFPPFLSWTRNHESCELKSHYYSLLPRDISLQLV